MKRQWILILALFVAAFAFQGCKDSKQEVAEDQAEAREDVREENLNATDEAKKDTEEFADDARGIGEEAAKDVKDAGDDVADSDVGQNVEEGLKEAGSEVKDAGITTAVKAKFAVDDVVKASNIDVDTENGIVTLNGTVASPRESTRAVELAESVDGVKSVRNRLNVNPS